MAPGGGYVRFFHDLTSGDRARHERLIDGWRRRDVSPYLNFDSAWRVLDLANGRLRPQLPLLAASGHDVVGLDLANRPARGLVDVLHGPARRLYLHSLRPLTPRRDPRLVAGAADSLPFRDSCFDLITSVAAFEHFLDVPRVLDEAARVLRPGGVMWACIHLFTSLSGGHNIGYISGPAQWVPAGMEPWDHLRRRRRPIRVPLNKWRRDQYLAAFRERFEVVAHYTAIEEGADLLTPALRLELGAYDAAELMAGAYVIAAVNAK